MKISELFSVEGKTALITGASGFLGRNMAQTLLENGVTVLAMGRSEGLSNLVSSWNKKYGEGAAHEIRVDMYDIPAFGTALDNVNRSFSVDILINNAYELNSNTGFNSEHGTLEAASHDMWMRNLIGGVYWPALATQKVSTKMKEAESGNIINISSMYGVVSPDPRLYEGTNFLNPPGYSAAKAGVLALTRYTASFLGKYNIRANAILPGPFSNTEDKTDNAVNHDDPFLEKLNQRTCLQRRGTPGELAGPLLFLASEASSYMTGHALVVDGGWTVI